MIVTCTHARHFLCEMNGIPVRQCNHCGHVSPIESVTELHDDPPPISKQMARRRVTVLAKGDKEMADLLAELQMEMAINAMIKQLLEANNGR